MTAPGDSALGNDERAIILELGDLIPGLARPSEHLLDRAHPEYVSCRGHVNDGVTRMDALVARLKQLRPA